MFSLITSRFITSYNLRDINLLWIDYQSLHFNSSIQKKAIVESTEHLRCDKQVYERTVSMLMLNIRETFLTQIQLFAGPELAKSLVDSLPRRNLLQHSTTTV